MTIEELEKRIESLKESIEFNETVYNEVESFDERYERLLAAGVDINEY